MTYHSDFYSWVREQAALLRSRRFDDNRLDPDHLAEEIEDMGKSELRAVESYVVAIIVHFAKIAFSSNHESHRKWHAEIRAFHASLLDRYTESMRQSLDMAKIWRRVEIEIERAFAEAAEPSPQLPKNSMYTLDDFLTGQLEANELAQRLRQQS